MQQSWNFIRRCLGKCRGAEEEFLAKDWRWRISISSCEWDASIDLIMTAAVWWIASFRRVTTAKDSSKPLHRCCQVSLACPSVILGPVTLFFRNWRTYFAIISRGQKGPGAFINFYSQRFFCFTSLLRFCILNMFIVIHSRPMLWRKAHGSILQNN